MDKEIQDKKSLPGNDISGIPEENMIPEKAGENDEQDMDDLVHNTISDEIDEDEEIDEDDAVHHPVTNPSIQDDSEKDPDDMVHGN